MLRRQSTVEGTKRVQDVHRKHICVMASPRLWRGIFGKLAMPLPSRSNLFLSGLAVSCSRYQQLTCFWNSKPASFNVLGNLHLCTRPGCTPSLHILDTRLRRLPILGTIFFLALVFGVSLHHQRGSFSHWAGGAGKGVLRNNVMQANFPPNLLLSKQGVVQTSQAGLGPQPTSSPPKGEMYLARWNQMVSF